MATDLRKRIVDFLKKNREYDFQISDIASAINVSYPSVRKEVLRMQKDTTVVKTRIMNKILNMYQLSEWYTPIRKKTARALEKLMTDNVAKRNEARRGEQQQQQKKGTAKTEGHFEEEEESEVD